MCRRETYCVRLLIVLQLERSNHIIMFEWQGIFSVMTGTLVIHQLFPEGGVRSASSPCHHLIQAFSLSPREALAPEVHDRFPFVS